jgi:hypothetical protein
MDQAILESLFKRALKTCRFFPKVSEILEPIQKAEKTGAPHAAEEAWQQVLSIRRLHYNPDIPLALTHYLGQLPERVRQAARAADVFREFEAVEGLHVWAKEHFAESFIGYGELEQDKFLLPDGEIKNLLTGLAQAKALPAPRIEWQELRGRGEAYRAEMTTPKKTPAKQTAPICVIPQAGNGQPLNLDNLARRVIIPALSPCAICRKQAEKHKPEGHTSQRDKNLPEWRGWHAFRRGLATNLHTLGVDDKTIQTILRHGNVGLTMNVYVKSVSESQLSALDSLSEKFGTCNDLATNPSRRLM